MTQAPTKPRWKHYQRYAAVPRDWLGCPDTLHFSRADAIHAAVNVTQSRLIESAEKTLTNASIGLSWERLNPMMDALRMQIWSEMQKRGWVVLSIRIRFAIPRSRKRGAS